MFGLIPEGVGYFLSNVTLQKLIAFPPPPIENSFMFTLNSSLTETAVYQSMIQANNITTGSTTKITSLISSIPISIYFLGFVNYFSMTSLYILLNVKIPSGIFNYLSEAYKELNKDIFNLFGV